MATIPIAPEPYVHQAYPQWVYDKNYHVNGKSRLVKDKAEHDAAKKAGWLDTYKFAPGHNPETPTPAEAAVEAASEAATSSSPKVKAKVAKAK